MKKWLQQVKERWNQTSDSAWYQSLRTSEQLDRLVCCPQSAFHPEVFELLRKYTGDFRGKKVLLPSSGDNHAAFAFALLGAEVTSADISERQLENAEAIACRMDLNIRFVCEDTMSLASLETEAFDLVYTSNGTHSWIVDLNGMYSQIHRVLKPGGFSVMYDVHPFHRPFTSEPWKQPQIRQSYFDGPAKLEWRMQDLLNAMCTASLSIRETAELPAVDASFWFKYDELINQPEEKLRNINEWEVNPMAALPVWLTVVAQKTKE